MKLCAVCNKLVRHPLYFIQAAVIKSTNVHDVVVCAQHKDEKGATLPSLSVPGGLLEYAWQGEGQT